MMKTKNMLNTYQKYSTDFKFEEKVRMGEIKKFADGVIPESKFIFDRYNVENDEQIQKDDNKDGGDDYFSFFGSHEQAILKPESNFQNLHELMTYLPIDYYVLLQKGYRKPKQFKRTNMIMFNNLPVITKKSSIYSKTAKVFKALTYEDIQRCLQRSDALQILSETYSEREMQRLLVKYFSGKIDKFEFINFNKERIASYFHDNEGDLGQDHLDDFNVAIHKYKDGSGSLFPNQEEMNDYIKNQIEFEEIISHNSDYFNTTKRVQHDEKYIQALELEDLMSQTKLDEQRAASYIRQRERELLGLDKQVNRSGFIRFDDYTTKLQMMDHPLFLFGLKLHEMKGSLEFFDADFCNTLIIKSELFDEQSLKSVCQLLNGILVRKGFMGKILEVGKLKDVASDFDLNNIVLREGFKIQLRFQNFEEAYEAFHILEKAVIEKEELSVLKEEHLKKIDYETIFEKEVLKITFLNPEPNYYDGYFATQFESCIRDKFEGLDQIIEVPSDYVAKSLQERDLRSMRMPPGV